MKWNGRSYRPSNAQFITKKKPFDFQEALKPYGEKEMPVWNAIVADDTAAAAGGVVLGQIYHTSGAMKIRIT